MKSMLIDFIIPCNNPDKNWSYQLFRNIDQISNLLDTVELNVILINDGSNSGIEDKDIKFLDTHLKQFYYLNLDQNMGKGFALREGMKISNADVIVYTDIDFPYMISNYIDFCRIILDKKADIALGVRTPIYYTSIPLERKIISIIFNFALKFIFKSKISDTQAGIKAFSKDLKQVFLNTKTNGYLVDFEFLYSLKNNINIRYSFNTIYIKNSTKVSKLTFSLLFQELINLFRIMLN